MKVDRYDPINLLSDCYAEMMGRYMSEHGECHCALETWFDKRPNMTPAQQRALSTFISFWDALENLERETDQSVRGG
jgi:hypothetical protein